MRERRISPLRQRLTDDTPAADADFAMQLWEQDAEFCRRMLIAIESGKETCPVGVSKNPCTKNPVLADGWKKA